MSGGTLSTMNEADGGALLYHKVFKHEDWETAACAIIDIINHAARNHPGKPRKLVLVIEGHRTKSGAFDHDMWVLQHDIIQKLLTPWLDEVDMPLGHYRRGPNTTEARASDEELPLKLERDGDMVRLVSA